MGGEKKGEREGEEGEGWLGKREGGKMRERGRRREEERGGGREREFTVNIHKYTTKLPRSAWHPPVSTRVIILQPYF